MYQHGSKLCPSAVADIAEIEQRFNCRVEITQGQCVISGYHTLAEAGPICNDANRVDGIVNDSNKPAAVKVIPGAAALEASILHANVFLARLRFAAGTATASLCPAPTPQSCVEFLIHMSHHPHYRETWEAQSIHSS